jgi:hypothetical protein
MERYLADPRVRFRVISRRTKVIPAVRGPIEREKTMAEEQTSGALHNDRLTSPISAAAPGGPIRVEKAAAMAPNQWTLQYLIAALRESNRKKKSP